MRQWYTILCAGILIVTVTSASAQPQQHFEAGMEVSSFNYEEPNFMEEDGVLWGIFGNYEVLLRENSPHGSFKDLFHNGNGFNRFELDARILWGQVDYTSTMTGSLDEIDDWLFEIRGLTGCDFPVFEDQIITSFLGIGYRYLNDDSSGLRTTTNAAGYERESNYLYLPIGLKYFAPLQEQWTFEARGEFDIFLTGEQQSHLGDAVAGLGTVTNDQDSGWGARASVRLERKGERVDLFVEPYFRYWEIDDSNTAVVASGPGFLIVGLEPANESWEAGSRFGIRF